MAAQQASVLDVLRMRVGRTLREARQGREPPAPLRGRHVLDLGCGLGLAGIAAARNGADVLVVDANADAVTFAAENLALNGVDGRAATCSWADPALAAGRPFDLVIGGDILYSRAGAQA